MSKVSQVRYGEFTSNATSVSAADSFTIGKTCTLEPGVEVIFI